MRVLLITGALAEDTVKRYAQESSTKTEAFALKIPVAALLTPETIAKALKDVDVKGFDVILVPGLVRGDTSVITKAFGAQTFKGPRYAADLPTVLDSLGEVQLSTVVPACDLLREKLQKKALQEIEKAEQNREALLKKPDSMLIGDLAVGKSFPMRVLAEIVDAPLMDKETIQRLAKHTVETGADIIDVGMVAGESRPSDARRIVQAVKEVVDAPVSIDSFDPAEIREAVHAGADLVLSADAGNIKTIASCVSNVAVVVIPTNQRQGYFPKKAKERVRFLEQIIQQAKKLGVTRCIADLILEPSDVLESFIAFRQFADRNPNVPLFVGVSNVTELIDADSVGVNALLARLSSEVGASIMLATEKSDKAKGTVGEEVVAAKMMFLAKKRSSVPKDLGLDLLLLKDKRNREELYDKAFEKNMQVIAAEKPDLTELDAMDSFTIVLDRIGTDIVALHYASAKLEKPDKIIKGKTADAVYAKIIELRLVSREDHVAYLGSELAKAEIALRTGKEYIQDKAMFTK
ncbi:MAG: dihydropteroate synthase-like protein [Candidatus Bathyarchaeia archaeon]